MTISFKDTTRNYALDQLYDNKFPAGSKLKVYSGAAPGPNNAATGTLLATITLPATPWAAAAAGSKAKQGTWADVGVAAGNAGYYRLENAAGSEREEGTVTATGGGGDATIDNVSIAVAQAVSVSSLTRTL